MDIIFVKYESERGIMWSNIGYPYDHKRTSEEANKMIEDCKKIKIIPEIKPEIIKLEIGESRWTDEQLKEIENDKVDYNLMMDKYNIGKQQWASQLNKIR